jgi:drug/metabolite transporter (DMT)-like permease
VQIALALALTIVSSCALNAGYLLEHSVASTLPPLSVRHPVRAARMLLASPRWLLGFSVEAAGWGLYVAALSLAPLSLVQATAAGGIGILALFASRYFGTVLTVWERIGVFVAVAGLALLGVSLAGGHDGGTGGAALTVALWIVASLVAAVGATSLRERIGGGPAFGLATGILFAAGDVATKAAVSGGAHFAFVLALVVCYGLGTVVLQRGFQQGSALTTAGIATLLTNAVPIVAGMTIFGEALPGGWLGGVRIAAFVAVVVGAVALARQTGHAGGEAREPVTEPADSALPAH